MAVIAMPLLKLLGPEHGVHEIREPEQRQDQSQDLIEHLKTLASHRIAVEQVKAQHRREDQNKIEHGLMLRRSRFRYKPPNG
jgi:hypothetical protein